MNVALRCATMGALLLVPCAWAAAELSESARAGRDTYYALEARAFDSQTMRDADATLSREMQRAPNEPWVLIAASRFVLNAGYISGDRTSLTSFKADAVKIALDLAKRAVANGDTLGMAHANLGRLFIITENDAGAVAELDRAAALDPAGFHAWYYRALLSIRKGDRAHAAAALKEAKKRAVTPHHKGWVLERLIGVARMENDLPAQEKYHKELIAFDPGEAAHYGNYALFLQSQKRYDESIEYYRKAIAIRPYPLAIEQMKRSELLRDSAKK